MNATLGSAAPGPRRHPTDRISVAQMNVVKALRSRADGKSVRPRPGRVRGILHRELTSARVCELGRGADQERETLRNVCGRVEAVLEQGEEFEGRSPARAAVLNRTRWFLRAAAKRQNLIERRVVFNILDHEITALRNRDAAELRAAGHLQIQRLSLRRLIAVLNNIALDEAARREVGVGQV